MARRDSLRLPSYRSSHGRRYHPYPTSRRQENNDEFYMDPVRDFDFEAAEHVLELPPSPKLHPVRRGDDDDDDDDDVTAFELAGNNTKKSDKGGQLKEYVVVEIHEHVEDELRIATARPANKLAKLYTFFLALQYVLQRLVRVKPSTAQQPTQ